MTQILTKNMNKLGKIEVGKIEREITNLIIQLEISPTYFDRVLGLYTTAKNIPEFRHVYNKHVLAICFYRLNLEKKLYISLRTIKKLLDIRSAGFLSNHVRLYEKFTKNLDLSPIRFTPSDHISNICGLIGLGNKIEKKAINLVNMIDKYFGIPGEYRTCALASIYFATNFERELLSAEQFEEYFDLISPSVWYDKIKIFEKYMKEFFRRKAKKTHLTNRERYFLNEFSTKHRDNFFRKFKSIKD